MAVSEVFAIIHDLSVNQYLNWEDGDLRVPAVYDSTDGKYHIRTDALTVTSWWNPNHKYSITIHAVDDVSNETIVESNDASFSTQLNIRTLEKQAPNILVYDTLESRVCKSGASYAGISGLTISENQNGISSGINSASYKVYLDNGVLSEFNGMISPNGSETIPNSNGDMRSYSPSVSIIIPSESVIFGDHIVRFEVADNDGNPASSEVPFLAVDSTIKPQLEILEPESGKTYLRSDSSEVHLKFRIRDSSVPTSFSSNEISGVDDENSLYPVPISKLIVFATDDKYEGTNISEKNILQTFLFPEFPEVDEFGYRTFEITIPLTTDLINVLSSNKYLTISAVNTYATSKLTNYYNSHPSDKTGLENLIDNTVVNTSFAQREITVFDPSIITFVNAESTRVDVGGIVKIQFALINPNRTYQIMDSFEDSTNHIIAPGSSVTPSVDFIVNPDEVPLDNVSETLLNQLTIDYQDGTNEDLTSDITLTEISQIPNRLYRIGGPSIPFTDEKAGKTATVNLTLDYGLGVLGNNHMITLSKAYNFDSPTFTITTASIDDGTYEINQNENSIHFLVPTLDDTYHPSVRLRMEPNTNLETLFSYLGTDGFYILIMDKSHDELSDANVTFRRKFNLTKLSSSDEFSNLELYLESGLETSFYSVDGMVYGYICSGNTKEHLSQIAIPISFSVI